MYTNLSISCEYKAPNIGESLLLGAAQAFGGGYGSFGALTGMGGCCGMSGMGGFMGSPVGIGMGCGSWSSQIAGIISGTAMNIAMSNMGYGGCGMYGMYGMPGMYSMYGYGGYSTDFALAQAGVQIGSGLATIGASALEKFVMSKSEKKAIKSRTEARYKSLAEAKLYKEKPEIKTNIDNAQKAVEAAKIIDKSTKSIEKYTKTIEDCDKELKRLATAPEGEKPEAEREREANIERIKGIKKTAENSKRIEEENIKKANAVLVNAQVDGIDIVNMTPDKILEAANEALKKANEEKDDAINALLNDKKGLEVQSS